MLLRRGAEALCYTHNGPQEEGDGAYLGSTVHEEGAGC